MKHKYIDYLNIEYSLDSNTSINHNILNTNNRLAKHLSIIEEEQKNVPENSIMYIHLVIEKFLYILLSKSCIGATNHTDITTHYEKYKHLPTYSTLISEDVKRILTYGKSYMWFGEYGSILHDVVDREIVTPYLSSSQLSRIGTLSSLKALNLFNEDLYTQTIRSLEEDSVEADYVIYKVPEYLITKSNIKEVYTELTFIEEWINELMLWYLDPSNPKEFYYYTKTQTERVLQDIAQYILRQGVFNLECLGFNLLHNRLLEPQINIYNKLKLNVSLLDLEGLTTEDIPYQLAIKLRNNITNNLNDLNDILYLLTLFCPPGGYNKLLVSVALELLNRAYILTDPSNTAYSLNTLEDFQNVKGWLGGNNLVRNIEDKDKFTTLVNRVISLCGLASNTLKKSSINDINLVGSRLERVFNIPTFNIIRNKELI
jgi:hypothetical protein